MFQVSTLGKRQWQQCQHSFEERVMGTLDYSVSILWLINNTPVKMIMEQILRKSVVQFGDVGEGFDLHRRLS